VTFNAQLNLKHKNMQVIVACFSFLSKYGIIIT